MITYTQQAALRSGAIAGHIAGVHRLAALLNSLGDVAKALREGEDDAALGMLEDVIERGVRVAREDLIRPGAPQPAAKPDPVPVGS
jgi:hypothetical protein